MLALTVGVSCSEPTAPEVEESLPAALAIDQGDVSFRDPGDSLPLSVTVRDQAGAEMSGVSVSWTSRDPSVATADGAGLVTAVDAGSTYVVASVGTLSDSVLVAVAPELTLAALGVGSMMAEVGTEVSISARVEDVLGTAFGGADVTWSVAPGSGDITSSAQSSSDPTGHVAAVWRLGTLAGLQRAFASLETRGQVVTVEFEVTGTAAAAAAAELLADSVLLSARGETVFLAPAYFDAFGNATGNDGATWDSGDPSVATVAADGLVTGAGPGATYVSVSRGAVLDSILVTVELRGAITITFDDGWLSVYENAWPVLEQFNLRANVGVYTEAVGWPSFMSEAHLTTLHDAGWSMVSHTVSHDSLSTLSAAELDYELRMSKGWLDERGFRGSNVLIAPYHDFGPAERAAAAEYYTAARGTSAHAFVPDSLVQWRPDNPYALTGMVADDLPYTTVQGRDRLRAMLQRTLDEGAFVDLLFHEVPLANVDAFQELLLVVDEFRDRVLPYHELFPIWARAVF